MTFYGLVDNLINKRDIYFMPLAINSWKLKSYQNKTSKSKNHNDYLKIYNTSKKVFLSPKCQFEGGKSGF